MSADSAKIIPPRYLHSTQWGLLCPLHSPDGGNVGLHNHMTVLANITSGESIKNYIKYLRQFGVKLLEECKYKYLYETTKVFINGLWLGNTDMPIELVKLFKLHRRNNIVNISIPNPPGLNNIPDSNEENFDEMPELQPVSGSDMSIDSDDDIPELE